MNYRVRNFNSKDGATYVWLVDEADEKKRVMFREPIDSEAVKRIFKVKSAKLSGLIGNTYTDYDIGPYLQGVQPPKDATPVTRGDVCGSLRKIAGHLTAATDELWVLIHNLEGKDDAGDADTGVSK